MFYLLPAPTGAGATHNAVQKLKKLISGGIRLLPAALLAAGMACAQTLTFSSMPVTFQAQLKGTTGTQYLYVTNNGAQAVNFSAITVTGTNAGDFSIYYTSCTSPLAANAYCYLDLQFTPSTIGTESAQLNFADNAP